MWATSTIDGRIMTVSDALARLLNFASKSLAGRDIYIFIGGDRDNLRRAVGQSTEQFPMDRDVVVQPRDRKPLPMHVIVQRQLDSTLLWVFSLRRPR